MSFANRRPNPPKPTIRRLSIYLRCLNNLEKTGLKVVSSKDLAEKLSLNPAQVRKDLAHFGELGKRGVGYSVTGLRNHLIKVLGLETERKIGIVGAGGRLGHALALYKGFHKRNFKVAALFDNDPALIGQNLGAVGRIHHVREMPRLVKQRDIEIIVLAVPESSIEEVFELVSFSGVRAVLNFTPIKLLSTDEIDVHNVDLATELESLSYHLCLRDSGLSLSELP